MLTYATPEELAAWIDPDADPTPARPTNAAKLLRTASGLVDDALIASLYATDDTGLPTMPKVLQAVKDATCEQAAAWVLAGIDPALGASQLKRVVQSKSLSGVSVTYQASLSDAYKATLADARELTPAAWSILQRAGLLTNRANTTGNWGVEYQLTPTSPFVLGQAWLGGN